MTQRAERHILPPRPAAVGGGDTSSQKTGSLPDDLLARGAGRLRVTAFFATLGSATAAVVPHLTGATQFGNADEVAVRTAVLAGVFVVSLMMIAITYLRWAPQKILGTGQVWFVLIQLAFGAVDACARWDAHSFSHGIPAPVTLVLIFPVLVPTPPRRFVLMSVVSLVLLVPVLLLVPGLAGNPPADASVIVITLVPVALASALATIAAQVVYRLGRDLKRARQMGSYQLIAPLGKGGMGEVWRARHGMLAREAAIKLIRRDAGLNGSAEAVRRFQHEARVVAGLRSPHTIQLWDYGVTDDGALYYAMELLDGFDFDRLVSLHGPLPPERVVHFLVQACHSLAEAHAAGLVHRDIKPGNLFVTRRGGDVDIVKLLDFGLATQPLNERIGDTRVTVDGMIMGTPAYMAPEQVLGDDRIDGRADLYALGAVAWFLLTGRDVFTATVATQVMFAHLNAEPEAPSSVAKQPIPRELEAIVLRCLAKKPEERFATAEALSAALQAVPLAEPWTRARATAWWEAAAQQEVIADAPAAPGAALAETTAQPTPL